MASEWLKKLEEYFDNASDEQFVKDCIESGMKLRCKDHVSFDPLSPVKTTCDNCNMLIKAYAKYKEIDNYSSKV